MSTFAEIKRWDRQPLFLRVGFVVENLGTGKTMRVKSITQRGVFAKKALAKLSPKQES